MYESKLFTSQLSWRKGARSKSNTFLQTANMQNLIRIPLLIKKFLVKQVNKICFYWMSMSLHTDLFNSYKLSLRRWF